MKRLVTFIQKMRGTYAPADPVHDFFMRENSADKKALYDRALRGAQADQVKVLESFRTR